MPKNWRSYSKLTEAQVVAARRAARSRTERQLMLALAAAGRLTRFRDVCRERESKQYRNSRFDPRSANTLAMVFGVTQKSMSAILNRQLWKGLPE